MDALSDVLSTLRIRTSTTSRLEARGRWALRFPGDCPRIKFGSVLAGSLALRVQGMRRSATLSAGDFYLLTNSRPFTVTSTPPAATEHGIEAFRAARGADGVVRIGDRSDGQSVSLATGVFDLDSDASPMLLGHLPPLVHLRADDPATQPLHGLLQLLRSEDDASRPGALIAQGSIATLLLVQALRIYLRATPQPQGWLAALADRRVGAALSAVHADIGRAWTVEGLAHAAGMSRTAFALRFKELVGLAPLDYLTRWRMTVARGLLRESSEQVAHVAERVGYQSDTAFSAAFKRVTGASPASYRKAAAIAQAA